jgi:hypothetical protein
LPQPLPIRAKSEITKIKLYENQGSPPCCAVRAFLALADVPYETVEVGFTSKSEIDFSTYKKVPIITVNGLQINDSAIIIKVLTPICFGRALSDVEQVQVNETTTKGMLAYEAELFGNDKNIEKFLQRYIKDDGCLTWLLKVATRTPPLPRDYLSQNLFGLPSRLSLSSRTSCAIYLQGLPGENCNRARRPPLQSKLIH